MAASRAQSASVKEGAHLVLYDGVCGLCSRWVFFVLTHDRRALFTFASLQSATGRLMVERFGGNPSDLSSFCVVVNYRTNQAQMLRRSSATFFVAGQLGWPWKSAVILRVLPGAILDRVYGLVARNRYRVFGRYEQCMTPRPEFRRRFLE